MCPNFSNPKVRQEFDELTSMFGEDMAYLLWDRNNGHHLDKAPNGQSSKLYKGLLELSDKKTALTIKARTLSSNFKEWFGNSQVVDENGEPLLVYHGSASKIQIFDKDKIGTKTSINDLRLGRGFYFTNSLSVASEYHDEAWYYENSSDSIPHVDYIHPSFLNITSDTGKIDIKNIGNYMNGEFVAFESNQIKSIFNSGEYNRNSDNIYDSETLNSVENRRQTQINGSMSQEILSNFETFFPNNAFYNDDQRQVVASMVERGELQITCKF